MLEQIALLAGPREACFINEKPARLDLGGRLPRVIAKDGSESAAFNLSVVKHVVLNKGGRFVTRELRSFPRL